MKRICRMFLITLTLISFTFTACNNNITSEKHTQANAPTKSINSKEVTPSDMLELDPNSQNLNGFIIIGKKDLIFPHFKGETYLNHNNFAYFFYHLSDNRDTTYVKRIKGLDGFQDIISLAYDNYLGLFKDGSVKYWNRNDLIKNKNPYTIKNLTCSKVVGYYYQAFYLKKDGTVWYTKGLRNTYKNAFKQIPKQVNELKKYKIIDIAVSDETANAYNFLCSEDENSPSADKNYGGKYNSYLIALTSDGKILTWNDYFKKPKVKVLYENKDLVNIEAMNQAYFAITKQGDLYRWGLNNVLVGAMSANEQGIFVEDGIEYAKPTKMDLPGKVKQISLSETCVLVVLDNGNQLWSWDIYSYVAKKINLVAISNVFSSARMSIAYMNDGSIKRWGDNGPFDFIGKNDTNNIKTLSRLVVKDNKLISVN